MLISFYRVIIFGTRHEITRKYIYICIFNNYTFVLYKNLYSNISL